MSANETSGRNENDGNAEKKEPLVARASDKMDETVRTFFIAAFIALLIRAFLFEPFNIPSGSMIPNLLVGDYLFVSKYSYGYSSLSSFYGLLPIGGRLFAQEPARGDVVVFKLPSDSHTDYIKRLIGLPGDNIQVRNGLLYINGVAVQREKMAEQMADDYLSPRPASADYVETFPNSNKHVVREDGDDYPLDNTGVFTVPPGHYFFMGDNRDNSLDSRTDHVGFVPAENLVGRAEVLFFSFDDKVPFWAVWKWPFAVRWGRLFMKIH